MTYSLVAHCPRTDQVGVGVMTAMMGCGKLVPWALPGVGAAASQAYLNPYLAIDGLRRMQYGRSAQQALDALVEADPGKKGRQFGIVDMHGGSASWTGSAPQDWKGHRTGEHWACQGNRLAGPQVLDAAIEAFLSSPDDELVVRLIAALDAAEDAGGDRKGHRSATIYVLGAEEYPLWDLRIDSGDDPLAALHTLHHEIREHLLAQVERMPTREDPTGDYDFLSDEGAV